MYTVENVINRLKGLGLTAKSIRVRGSGTFIAEFELTETTDDAAYAESIPIYRTLQIAGLAHGSMYDHVGMHDKHYQNMTVLIDMNPREIDL